MIHEIASQEVRLALGSVIKDCFSRSSVTAAAAKSLQLCPTLCDPIDGSPPGSPIPGILQARTLEWVAISFSSAWKWRVKVKSLSRVWLLATPWTAAYQAPPSMGVSRQEYWGGVPLPSPSVTTGSAISLRVQIFSIHLSLSSAMTALSQSQQLSWPQYGCQQPCKAHVPSPTSRESDFH